MQENFEQSAAQPQAEQSAPKTEPSAQGHAPRSAPVRVRRVGTFTLGFCLIAGGSLMIAKLFTPALDLLWVLRFSPVVLILLGIEILVYAVRPGVALKYDWVAMLLSLLLLGGSACAGAAAIAVEHFSPERSYRQEQLAAELQQRSCDTLRAAHPEISDLTVQVWLNHNLSAATDPNAQAETLTAADTVSAYCTLTGPFADKEAFAAACRGVMDSAAQNGLPFTSWQFDTLLAAAEQSTTGTAYQLNVQGPWRIGAPAAELTALTQETWYWQGCSYSSEADWQQATLETAAAEQDAAGNAGEEPPAA